MDPYKSSMGNRRLGRDGSVVWGHRKFYLIKEV